MSITGGLSTANKITIAVVSAGVISTFSVMQYQVGALKEDARDRTARFEMTASSYESRLRAVEIAQASQTSDLRNIQIGINEIKDQIRSIAGGSTSGRN